MPVSAYQMLSNTIQHLQVEENATESDPTFISHPAATPIPETDLAAGPENQDIPVSVASICKVKQWMQKSACLVRK